MQDLHLQAAWCQMLLSGVKTIEVHAYPLPESLRGGCCIQLAQHRAYGQHVVLTGRRIWLLASTGEDGVSNLKDMVQAGDTAAQVVGVASIAGQAEREGRALSVTAGGLRVLQRLQGVPVCEGLCNRFRQSLCSCGKHLCIQ